LVRAEPGSLTVSGKIPADNDGKKKKISVYERRKMKKQKQKQGTGETSDLDPEPSTESTEKPQRVEKTKLEQNPPKPKPVQYKKGQKAKLKKIKEKYAWQDEEDRKLNMELLGHREQQNPKKGKRGQITAEVQNLQAKHEHKKTIQKKQFEQEKEEEEIRMLLRDEKVEGLTEDEKKKIEELTAKGLGVNLTAFTGKPLPTDNLLYAIPVCAPYETLRDYKYKIKLIPGNEKKGKALKTCLDIFLRTDAPEREKDLIKGVPDPDWHLTLISNSKLAAAGLNPARGKKGKGKKK